MDLRSAEPEATDSARSCAWRMEIPIKGLLGIAGKPRAAFGRGRAAVLFARGMRSGLHGLGSPCAVNTVNGLNASSKSARSSPIDGVI